MTSFLETDNIAMGELGANLIIEFLKTKNGSAKGNVVEIQGLQGTSAARDRGKGFHNIIDKEKDIKIVASQAGDFNQEKSMNVMQNILQANAQIDAIFGHNDDCTLGAEKAIIAANRMKPLGDKDHIYIVNFMAFIISLITQMRCSLWKAILLIGFGIMQQYLFLHGIIKEIYSNLINIPKLLRDFIKMKF
jgi:DNA-binding LacI/PurR family transcriptional regulator